jgi:hypothetical protein
MIAEAAVSGLESFTDRLAVEEIEWLGRRPSGGEGEGEIGVTAMYEREGKSNGGDEGEEEELEEGEMEEGEREKEEEEEEDNNIEKQGGGEGEGEGGEGEGEGGEGEGEGDLVLNIDKVDNSDNNDEPHSLSHSHSHSQSDLQDDDPVYSCLPPSIARNYPSTPHPIGSYTLPPGGILPLELETLWLPVEVLEAHWAARRLSIVGQYDRRSYCFTHSYGRLYDKSSGSVYWEVSFRVN